MKNNDGKKQGNRMLFGEFVSAVCAAWGSRRGPRIVQMAVNRHLIKFVGEQRLVILEK
jgi:hypothetical protein